MKQFFDELPRRLMWMMLGFGITQLVGLPFVGGLISRIASGFAVDPEPQIERVYVPVPDGENAERVLDEVQSSLHPGIGIHDASVVPGGGGVALGVVAGKGRWAASDLGAKTGLNTVCMSEGDYTTMIQESAQTATGVGSVADASETIGATLF